MTITKYPDKYTLFNDLQTKSLSVVVQIDGVDDLISMVPVYKRIRFGDPIVFGGGQVWGGLIRREGVRDLLSIDGSLTLTQKIEPEQGKGSISTLSLTFVDAGEFMTQLCSPGILTDELLGDKEVRVWLGYQQTSWPEDYFVVFRGNVTQTQSRAGKVTLQVSDANFKKRSKVFYPAKTATTARVFYNSAVMQSFLFKAKAGGVGVQFVGGNSGDNASVSVSGGNQVIVTITPGVTTAATIKQALDADFTAQNLFIETEILGPDSTTQTTGSVTMQTTTTIPVVANGDFFEHILGPDGTYDSSVRTWIKVEDEYMEYGPGDKGANSFVVDRGPPNSRITDAVHHESGVEVSQGIEFEGNVVDLALKLMLSGWNGTYKDLVPIRSIVRSSDTDIGNPTDSIFLPNEIDADIDLGLVPGDYVTISSGVNAGTYVVTGFRDVFGLPNRCIRVDAVLTMEPYPTATLALRSQYDTFPIEAGLKMSPAMVDVARHRTYRSGYLSGTENRMRLFYSEQQEGKAIIENELFMPIGAYTLTRYGRVSMGLTLPPIAGEKLPTLNADTVLDPENIVITRGLNNRRFFNEIDVQYNYAHNIGRYVSTLRILDVNSLSIIGQVSVLPINAKGVHTDLGGDILLNRRARFLLTRYKDAAFEVDCSVMWGVGSTIEAGDVVLLVDEGGLQISNFATGERDLGVQLFEVIDRQIDIKSGRVKLKLLSNLGFDIDDRYATISPSSELTASSTSSIIEIRDSFGAAAGLGKENEKWEGFIGQQVIVHNYTWTDSAEVTLGDQVPGAPYRFNVSPALPFTPLDGYILDIAPYPTSTDKNENKIYKLLHAFIDPTVTVVTGISTTQFSVSVGDAPKFQVGIKVLIHSASYSVLSAESKVASVSGVTVTLETALAFTPSAGQLVELIGFQDGAGPYRLI
jgi:hypothetical protein